MQKFMSLVLSATMFAYMACGETPQQNADNTHFEKVSTDISANQTEETETNSSVPEDN